MCMPGASGVVHSTRTAHTAHHSLILNNLVLHAVQKHKLTLSPPKCFLGYQALLLLGQKVLRLEMSTHKEKIDAICNLTEPTNIHELQVFLGMMVYFSAYIPFYAWIVAPLFALLKKGTIWK